MGANLMDIISGYLDNSAVNKIAGSLGIGGDQARAGIGAALPAMLAGLIGASSTSEGARRLDNAVSEADTGIMSKFAGLLGGQATSLNQTGSSLLNSVFGGDMLNGLVSGVSRFTGLGPTVLHNLMAMCAPLVMGVLGLKKREMGLDASGLVGMLQGQRQNIMSAMPAGLSSVLGSVPSLSGLADVFRAPVGAARAAGEAAQSAYRGAADAAHGAYRATGDAVRDGYRGAADVARAAAPRTSNIARWLVPLAAALALAVLLYQMVGRNRTPTPAAATASGTFPTLPVEAKRFADQLRDVVGSTTTALADVKDAATADAAAPNLQAVRDRLEALRPTWDALPASARSALSTTIASSIDALRAASDRLASIPGAGDRLRPIIDDIIARLTALRA